MNGDRCESLFFTSLPDLRRLCAINVILSPTIKKSDLRDAQIKLCRYLLFQYQDIVASPLPDEFSQILLITAISFYKTGKLQAAVEKHGAKMESPVRAIPAFLQTCLSYTLTAKLAPRWNKAGHLLIQGEDFLSQMGRQNAIDNKPGPSNLQPKSPGRECPIPDDNRPQGPDMDTETESDLDEYEEQKL